MDLIIEMLQVAPSRKSARSLVIARGALEDLEPKSRPAAQRKLKAAESDAWRRHLTGGWIWRRGFT